MKTLAVLSALATLALAAPAAEDYADSTRLSPSDFTITQQREKKSTHLDTLSEKVPVHLEDHLSEKASNQFGPSNVVGRTFTGFKKPIIVKKKIGYHLYRDSDEEQSEADPRESCRKQIKVKLCDDNNSMDKVKSASLDQTHEISDSEIEHSINMAKEAVETFQRDLKKMELDSAERNIHRHAPLGADTELHKDIEKARLALEHIHRKFKTFDTATTNVDDKALNLHLHPLKSDEERIAQWKDALKLHQSVEIAKNLEDNFKSSMDKDVFKQLNLGSPENLKDEGKDFKATIEDINPSTNLNTKVEHDMTSIVEDKVPKMRIQSDNLVKANADSEAGPEKEEKMSRMEHLDKKQNEMSEKNAELHKMEDIKQLTEDKSKSADPAGHDLKMLKNHSGNHVDHQEMIRSNDDISASGNHAQINLEHDADTTHLSEKSTHGNDQVTHESKNINTISSTKSGKAVLSEELVNGEITAHKNNGHLDDNFDVENVKIAPKNVKLTDINHDQKGEQSHDNLKELHEETDKQRSMQIPAVSTKSEDLSVTILRAGSESNDHKNHDFNKDIKTEKGTPVHRASLGFNRDLLNNMEFVEDSHQMALHEPSLTQTSHILKNEQSNLHERLNVPHLQPNSQHLKTMMDFSDNTHHLNQQLKMASMFDNEQPNINVQFNSPQDFQDQTNVQEIIPFRASENTQSKFNERFHSMHDQDSSTTELHDPLKIRWAKENNLNSEMLNAASQLHHEHMRMDGSSQHLNIEKMAPFRSHLTNDQLSLNEQIKAQQRWAQAKSLNTHQSMPMNSGFDHLHGHEILLSRHNNQNLMMQEKSNVDNTMQPNSFTQMRGAPKTSLDYMNPNQWSHNQGVFRSSYGPSMASYGSGGGQTSGGPAVGVFPNANVGNCAVPLLVSCSPSVTSGSLTKTQPSQNGYSSPSYRTEDINFLKKRGVDINEGTPGLHLHRLGAKTLANGPNVILAKKQ